MIDSRIKIYRAPVQELVRQTLANPTAAGTCAWRVKNPGGMRVYVKTGIVWKPFDGSVDSLPEINNPPTLWIAGHESPDDFPAGAGGNTQPVENFLGTAAAPLSVPTDSGLAGKCVTVQTALSGIRGVFNQPNATKSGSWMVHADWFAATDLCDDEWREIVGGCALILENGSFLPLQSVT